MPSRRSGDRSPCRVRLRSVVAIAAASMLMLSVGAVAAYTILADAETGHGIGAVFVRDKLGLMQDVVERTLVPLRDAGAAAEQWALQPGQTSPATQRVYALAMDAATTVTMQIALGVAGNRTTVALRFFDGDSVVVVRDESALHAIQVRASNSTSPSRPCCGDRVVASFDALTLMRLNETVGAPIVPDTHALSQLAPDAVAAATRMGVGYREWAGPRASMAATGVVASLHYVAALVSRANNTFGLVSVTRPDSHVSDALRTFVRASVVEHAVVTTTAGYLYATTTEDALGSYVPNGVPDSAGACVAEDNGPGAFCLAPASESAYTPLRLAAVHGHLSVPPNTPGYRHAELDASGHSHGAGVAHFSHVVAVAAFNNRRGGPSNLVLSLYASHEAMHPGGDERIRVSVAVAVSSGVIGALLCVVIVTVVLMPVGDLATALRLTATYYPAPSALLVAQSNFREVWALEQALRRLVRLMATFKAYVPRDVIRAFVAARNDPRSVTAALRFKPVAKCTVLAVVMENFAAVTGCGTAVEMAAVLAAASKQLQQLLRTFGGSIVAIDGDNIVAAWNAVGIVPNAEFRAVLCALLLHRSAITGPFADAMDNAGEWARARIGVATGPALAGVVAGRSGRFTIVGEAVNAALRLQARAVALESKPLVSESTIGPTGRLFVARPLLVRVAPPPGFVHTPLADMDPRNLRFDDGELPPGTPSYSGGGSSRNLVGSAPRAAKVHEVLGLATPPPVKDTMALRQEEDTASFRFGDDDSTAGHGARGRQASSDGGADDDEARGRVDTLRLLDMALSLLDCPVEATPEEVAVARACRRAVKALMVGRVWVARRRALRLFDQLPEGHWAYPATAALVDALSANRPAEQLPASRHRDGAAVP